MWLIPSAKLSFKALPLLFASKNMSDATRDDTAAAATAQSSATAEVAAEIPFQVPCVFYRTVVDPRFARSASLGIHCIGYVL